MRDFFCFNVSMSSRKTRASSKKKKGREPSGSAPVSEVSSSSVAGAALGEAASAATVSLVSGVARSVSGVARSGVERAGGSSVEAGRDSTGTGSSLAKKSAPAEQVGGDDGNDMLVTNTGEPLDSLTRKGAGVDSRESAKSLQEYVRELTRIFSSCCSSALEDGMNGLEISRWLKAAQHAARSADFLMGSMPDGLYGFMHTLVAHRLGPVAAEVAINMGHDHGHESVESYLGEVAGQALRASAGFVRSRAAARRILFSTKQDEGESVRSFMKRYKNAADTAVVGMWVKWDKVERGSWHRETVNGLHEGLSSSVLRRALTDVGTWRVEGGRFEDYWGMLMELLCELDDDVSGPTAVDVPATMRKAAALPPAPKVHETRVAQVQGDEDAKYDAMASRKSVQCYGCGERGHIRRHCKKQRGYKPYEPRGGDVICYKCGKTGHIARFCGNGETTSNSRDTRRNSREGAVGTSQKSTFSWTNNDVGEAAGQGERKDAAPTNAQLSLLQGRYGNPVASALADFYKDTQSGGQQVGCARINMLRGSGGGRGGGGDGPWTAVQRGAKRRRSPGDSGGQAPGPFRRERVKRTAHGWTV